MTFPTPTVSDNEDPTPEISCSPASGTAFPIGQTVVTCTAKDAQGNTATKSFTVTVRGTRPVGGTVPATLSLTLGTPASFGAFVPGVDREYTATSTANVISTAGDATLSVSDPGNLTNGSFSLPEKLRVEMTPASWTGPVSNAAVAITFRQHIGANVALRTGTYSKTLTFTLSTTTP